MALTVGVDVGGTKVLAGVVTEDGLVVERRRKRTPSDDVDDTARVIGEVVAELESKYDIVGVGVGAAGWMDSTRSVALHAPNMAWRNEPLKDRIQAFVDVPVVIENDGNAAAWAEYRFGAGRGEEHLILLTVGTGIAGGIVLGGQLYRGAFGIAGEFAHVRVVPGDGLACGCGDRGCFEQYCSGKALVRQARAAVLADPLAGERLLTLADGHVERIDGPHVTQAAQEGDPLAVGAFTVIGEWLGRGMADIVAGWDPGRIVVGGGVAEAGDLLLGPARVTYNAIVQTRGRKNAADIRQVELGSEAGLVGAADLARLG